LKFYILTIITVSVISGIISAMLANGENSLKKHINFITGLICAIALLSPVVTIAKNAGALTNSIEGLVDSIDLNNSINQGNEIIIEAGTEQISKGVKEAIINKYNFGEEEISVVITVNDDKIDAIKLTGITVTLTGKASWTDSNSIKQYVEGLVGCPVKVIKR